MVSVKVADPVYNKTYVVQWVKQKINNFFIVAPCILVSPKFFIHQQTHFLLVLENSKIYINTYIKIAPTSFGLRPSSGSLHLSLDKVTLMLKQSVTLRHYVLCGDVAACYAAKINKKVHLLVNEKLW
jgi:hypothetical protein